MEKKTKIKISAKAITVIGYCLLAVAFTSCNDFLTIYPTDKTIGEDFWKSKEDVKNMAAGAYSSMTSEGCQEKAIIWGAFRSDELVKYKDNSNADLENINAVNLLPTNGYNSWADFYGVINRCNIVLNHIGEVMESDPAFTQGDHDEIRAQMLALRSLCYFYLVRTFRDVPYTTQSYEDDDQVMEIPQSSPDSVLQVCINDLEESERYIMKTGAYGIGNWRNKGYFTTDAVRALLADIYLWRGSINHSEADYQKCVEYADKIIEAKHEYYQTLFINSQASMEKDNYHLTNGVMMFEELFIDGNSHESILEWQYNSENTGIGKYYLNGSNSKNGVLLASKIFTYCEANANTEQGQVAFYTKNDYRFWNFVYDANNVEAIDGLGIQKMVETFPTYLFTNPANFSKGYEKRDKMQRWEANWIVYRLTDIMLMKAEALVQLAAGSDDENLERAFNLVQTINKRSMYREATDTLTFGTFKSKEQMELLVLAERERELCFEGKRWYDLMRYCYRHMEGVDLKTKMADRTEWPTLYRGMLSLIVRKYVNGGDAVSYKMKSEPFLYWPILEREVRVNRLLKQNPVFIQDESTSKN